MSETQESLVSEMLDALCAPFPPNAVEQREGGGGKMLSYVSTETVIRRLNRTVGVWDFKLTETKVFESAGNPPLLVVWGELTIPELGTRAGTGVQLLRGGEDMWKGAASDCLKKCATLFGVAIELYGPDLEMGEVRQEPQYAHVIAQDAPQQTETRQQGQNSKDFQSGPQQQQIDQYGVPLASPAQVKFLYALMKLNESESDVLDKACMDRYGVGLEELTKQSASAWINFLKG